MLEQSSHFLSKSWVFVLVPYVSHRVSFCHVKGGCGFQNDMVENDIIDIDIVDIDIIDIDIVEIDIENDC